MFWFRLSMVKTYNVQCITVQINSENNSVAVNQKTKQQIRNGKYKDKPASVNIIATVSLLSSSNLNVSESFDFDNFNTLFNDDKLIPNEIGLSHLYVENAPLASHNDTNDTCDESIACNLIPS